MPDSIVKESLREIDPLSVDDTVGAAAKRVVQTGLPALPAVDGDGKFAGIFGEREFMAALFPGYFKELSSSAMISRSMDEAIDRRVECADEPISRYLTEDAVVVDDDYSDTHLAELFLHHRVLVIPIASGGRIHAVVTRQDFFQALVARFIRRTSGEHEVPEELRGQ
jgi:CBS domain-containing protein